MEIRGKTLFIGGAVLALGLGGGVAVAQIPATDGTISGCFVKSTGTIRIIDHPSKSCKSNETLIQWNQDGNPGVDGEDGQDGVSGYEVVTKDVPVDDGVVILQTIQTVECPAGKKVMGGGAVSIREGNEVYTTSTKFYGSTPNADGSGWVVSFGADGDSIDTVQLRATCITA